MEGSRTVAGSVEPRLVKRGDTQLVWAVITEVFHKNISAVGFQVAHVLDTDKNDDQSTFPWESPHALSGPGASTYIYRVGKLLAPAALVDEVKTKYRVFVRASDSPEVVAIDCGTYSVTP